MTSAKPKEGFKGLDLKKARAAVNAYAESNHVPDLTYPDNAKPPGEVIALPVAAASSLAETITEQPTPTPAKAAAPRRTKKVEADPEEGPTRRMTLDLPTYLFKAINQRGFDQGACAKYIILTALKNDNFTVLPEDMKKDGRRAKRELRHDA